MYHKKLMTGATSIMEVTVTPRVFSPFFTGGSGVESNASSVICSVCQLSVQPSLLHAQHPPSLTDWGVFGLEQGGLGGGAGEKLPLLQKGEIICSGSFNQTMLKQTNRS